MSFRRPTLTVAYNYVCAVSVVFTPTPRRSKCVKTNTSLVCQFKSFFLSCVSAQCRFEVMPTFLKPTLNIYLLSKAETVNGVIMASACAHYLIAVDSNSTFYYFIRKSCEI